MPILTPKKPFDSRLPVLRIDNDLAEGKHLFSLVVIDDRQRESAPDFVSVIVRKPRILPDVIVPLDPRRPLRPGLISPRGRRHGPS